MKKYLIIAIVSLFICSFTLLSTNCASKDEGQGVLEGKNFTLKDINGTPFTLSSYKGENIVVLVFGATWCPYCVKEIPYLKELFENYKDKGVILLSIDIQESLKKVSAFKEKHNIPYTVLLDETGEVARGYGVYGIPAVAVLDKSLKIRYNGHVPKDGLEKIIDEILKGEER